MSEVVVPPLRTRMPSTAGPWHVVGAFETGGSGDLEPGLVSGPSQIDGVDSWEARLDERLAGTATGTTAGPAAVRQLTLGGRALVPAPPVPASIAVEVAPERWHRPFLLFQLDGAAERGVVEGIVDVNGALVAVSTFDTPADLVDRINRSGVGATARLDPLTGRLVVTSTARGTGARLTFGADTSGALAVLGIDSGRVRPGRDAGFARPLAELFPTDALAAGTIVVNHRAVAVDPEVDEFPAVLDRISGSTDAVVRFDPTSRRVVLSVSLPPGTLEIDDATGCLEAFGFTPGAYASAGRRPGGGPALVIRSWLGAGDRVATRIDDPSDLYRPPAIAGRVDGAIGRSAGSMLADRVAASPPGGSAAKGSPAEEIAVSRRHLVQR